MRSFVPNPVAPLLRHVRGAGQLRGAGDVDVRPRVAVDELLEEERSRDRPRVRAAHVGHVGDGGVELAAVRPVERKLPDRLVDEVPGGLELLEQVGVVAHEPGDLDAERPQAGAGQRRDVDDGVDRLLDGEATDRRPSRAVPRRRC